METTHVHSAMPAHIPLARQALNFGRHFLEMCVSMCAVGTPVVLLLFRWVPSALGVVSPANTVPEASLVVISIIYATPMILWMRFRGMEWRPVLEMGGVTVAVAAVFIVLRVAGVLDARAFGEYVGPQFCGAACVVMAVAMLPRLSLYTGRSGHHRGV